MRISAIITLGLTVIGIASAETTPAIETGKAGEREIALEHLLSERDSPTAFAKAIDDAGKAGVSAQAILEARFLYHVDRREDAAIARMLPEFLQLRDDFKLEDSAIFGVKEDWLAVVEYVQAIAALEKGDRVAFKTHITEAFWLSPKQASAFATHIDRLRLDESMREVRIDFKTRLTHLNGGDAVALGSLMVEKKAMIFHFWSPVSSESEASMPDFITTAQTLADKGIAVVSILQEGTAEDLAAARAAIRPLGLKPPGAWLIDSADQPLAREFRVQALPVFVLVSNEGRVLFNGHPSDPLLWDALAKIDPRIVRPGAVRAPD